MADKYSAHFLASAKEYVDGLSEADKGAIAADVDAMRSGDLKTPHTKQLRGSIRELISGYHRLTYFIIRHAIYFVTGFRKKSGKTPRKHIEYTEKIHQKLKQ